MSSSTATQRFVRCGGARRRGQSAQDALVLNTHGRSPNVVLKVGDVNGSMARNLPDALVDLLELATYVFAADQATTRGGLRDAGERWHRRFRLDVALRCPEVWNQEPVQSALVEVLSFLSDDDYEFGFSKLDRHPDRQLYFDAAAPEFRVDEVVLFSGGLDSFAGAIQEVLINRHDVALVTHRSSSKRNRQIDDLAKEIGERAGSGGIRHIGVRAGKSQEIGKEYTQRTRSFLHASLAVAISVLMGKDRFSFFENGVTSINLPLAPQLVGGRASRTTHPKAIDGFSRLFSLLLDRTFTVDNPFLWKTKTDVVRLIQQSGCGSLIGRAVSCSHTYEASKEYPHCGRCSQCIDRRFATLAAGLTEEEDPSDKYKVDLLAGERPPGVTRAMAESFLQRAEKLRRLTLADVFIAYPEAARVLRRVGSTSDEATRQVVELHRRHGEDVAAALAEGHRRYAREFQAGALPDSCLLVMAIPEQYLKAVDPNLPATPTFRLEGEFWRVWFANEQAMLKDSVGMRHIGRLLASPSRNWHSAELLADEAGHTATIPSGSAGEASDRVSLRSYKARLRQIEDELSESGGDPAREMELRQEAAGIEAHLRETTSLRGRARSASSDAERARKAVSNAVRRAMGVIGNKHVALWRHLRTHMQIGSFCSYDPEPPVAWLTR